MYKNLQEYIEARTAWLLREGITPEELRRRYWDDQRTVPEIARIAKVHAQTLYELMRKHKIPRRSRTDTNYLVNRHKPQFRLREDLTPEQEQLRIAGLMLYWAEGAKRGKNTVDLANSDPRIVQLFLRFLREICGVGESRLRVLLLRGAENVSHLRPRSERSDA